MTTNKRKEVSIRCPVCKGAKEVPKVFPFGTQWVNVGKFPFADHALIRKDTHERVGAGHRSASKWADASDIEPTEPCRTCDSTGWVTERQADKIIEIQLKVSK
jgi:hypothetical protein